jgi:hypothetical protein
MKHIKENPAAAAAAGGAEIDIALTKSKHSTRRRRRQTPAAPAFALSRPNLKYGPLPPLWRVAFADGRELLMCTNTMALPTEPSVFLITEPLRLSRR